MSEPWFEPNTFGALYGGIGGSAMGLLGGVIGTLAGILAPRGQGRALVLGLMGLMVGLGLVSLGIGVAALLSRQPYGIWYPATLLGVLGAGLGAGLTPVIRKRYAEAEQRRMDADGLRHS